MNNSTASKMSGSLTQVLHEVDNSKGTATHYTYFCPKREWSIKVEKLEHFWESYCQLVQEKSYSGHIGEKLSVAEIQGPTAPILVNCVLRFHRPSTSRPHSSTPRSVAGPSEWGKDDQESSLEDDLADPYDHKFVEGLIICYQRAIDKYLKVTEKSAELICCVLEPSENYCTNDELIVQIKLQFPYCRTTLQWQKAIRSHAIELLRRRNVIATLPQQPINDWNEILDASSAQEPWPLFGSVTDPKHPVPDLTNIYNRLPTGSEYNSEDYIVELKQVFNLHGNGHLNLRHVSPGLFNIDEDEIHYLLPLFLSLSYYTARTHIKPEIATPRYMRIETPSSEISNPNNDFTPPEMARSLLSMITHQRAEEESSWMAIGKAIHKTFDGSREGLELWFRFTKQGGVFIDQDCSIHYPSFRSSNAFTIKTIAWYAKLDNSRGYNDWHRSWVEPAMEKALDRTHTNVAIALRRCYWLDFCCVSREHKVWYQFVKHHWIKLDKGLSLRRIISGDFCRRFERFQTRLCQRRDRTEDQRIKEGFEAQIKAAGILIKSMRGVSYKNNLQTEAMEHFYDKDFLKVADQNPDLMGVSNGIIECGEERAFFRTGKPEDYVTKCSDVYWEDFTWEDAPVKMFMEWMNQCFVDDELREFFFRFIASRLRSGNSDKIASFFTGDGDNSKSAVKKLLEMIYGCYTHTFPTTTFTEKRRSSSAPSPELALAKDTKLAFIQEPDSDDTMKDGIFKEMVSGCGGDGIFVRLLHDNGGIMKPTFILIIICNKIPIFVSADRAVQNRVMIMPFLSRWTQDAPNNIEEQFRQRHFKVDKYFNVKIPFMGPGALWVFVQKYADYKKMGLKKPDIVKKTTEEYWAENDVYRSFIRENLKPAIVPGTIDGDHPEGRQDPHAKIALTDLYRTFKGWYKDNFPNMKIPERNIFRNEMNQPQRLNKIHVDQAWHGIQPIIPMAMAGGNIPGF